MRAFLMAALLTAAAAPVGAEILALPMGRGHLEGEMLTPLRPRHALVLIPGAGPIDRDGNGASPVLRSDSYRLLAEGLEREGIASIRIDKRGMFGSASVLTDPEEVTIADYASDARAWIKRAADLAPCVWLAGHSEGGLVALAVAADTPPPELCGLILLATPGRPFDVLLLEQMASNPASALMIDEIAPLVADLKQGGSRDPESLSPVIRPLFSSALQRYMSDVFTYVPAELAKSWPGEALILQGTADMQVRGLDADLLARAMSQAERVDLVGATHLLKLDVPGKPYATYMEPSLPLHPDLVPQISDYLARHVSK